MPRWEGLPVSSLPPWWVRRGRPLRAYICGTMGGAQPAGATLLIAPDDGGAQEVIEIPAGVVVPLGRGMSSMRCSAIWDSAGLPIQGSVWVEME